MNRSQKLLLMCALGGLTGIMLHPYRLEYGWGAFLLVMAPISILTNVIIDQIWPEKK